MKQTDTSIGLRDIFIIFLKAGMAFGGGLGILAVLEDELVTRRKALSRDEFLTIYGIGRVVPSGTMTALAVAFGYRFGGLPGTALALVALVLPAVLIAVVLTIAYGALSRGPVLDVLRVSVLPAALGLIVAAAVRLGKDVFRPSFELLLAVAAFVGAALLHINTAILLVAGGALGFAWATWGPGREQQKEDAS